MMLHINIALSNNFLIKKNLLIAALKETPDFDVYGNGFT